jgi:hypothetical protein
MDILKAQRLDGHQTLHSFLASTSEYRLWGENHVLKLAPVLKHRPGLTRTDWTLDIAGSGGSAQPESYVSTIMK